MAGIQIAESAQRRGQWIVVQVGKVPTPGEDWRALVGTIPHSEATKVRERYGREERVQGTFRTESGQEVPSHYKTYIYGAEEARQVNRDLAILAWLDCEDLDLVPPDEESAKAQARMVGFPEEQAHAGVRIPLKGRLTPQIKFYILDNDPALALFIVGESGEISRREYKKREDARGNS